MQDVPKLLEKARAEWQQLLQPLPGGSDVLLSILESYSQPHRHYHTLQHIGEMTLLLAEYRNTMSGLADVFFACLYHDIVYDARATDNEEKSAMRWQADAERLGIAAPQQERVTQLILATKKHELSDDSTDLKMFLDADLAILGAEPVRYQAYAHGVRYEYAHVPESEYRPGRSAVLKKFIGRPGLYFSEVMRERFEARARKNMALELQVMNRKDSFTGEFSENASGLLTFNIDSARSGFYEAFKRHVSEHFGFHEFSQPIWSPDSTIGTCGNGKLTLEWGHDFFSGFYFYGHGADGAKAVREIGEYLNTILAGTEFNIYREYLFVDFDPA